VGAVTRAPQGVVRTVPETRALLTEAMQEVADVAGASGAPLPKGAVEKFLAMLDEGPAEGIGAMQRDIMAGRPSELETQIGVMVRLGHSHGVQVPRHTFLYASLLPQELKARGRLQF